MAQGQSYAIPTMLGMKEDDPRVKNLRQWKGENLLGFGESSIKTLSYKQVYYLYLLRA